MSGSRSGFYERRAFAEAGAGPGRLLGRGSGGEQVLIAGGAPAQPLIKEVYTRVLDAGAIPVPQVALPGLQEIFFEHARDIHYQKTPPALRAVYEGADAVITIMAPHNTKALACVDPRKQQALGKRDKALQDMILEKDRWALTLFPTQALAQESEMSLEVRGVRLRGDGAERGRPGPLLA